MSKKKTQLQGILLSAFASIAQRSGKLTETVLKGSRCTIVVCIFLILVGPTVLRRYLLRY